MENNLPIKSISELYLHSDSADVHFKCQSENVPAHKAILSIASPVFKETFFGPMKSGEIIDINDDYITASAFAEFLQFFYRPKVTLTMENIESVCRLADRYVMADCLNVCAKFLERNLTDENIIWAYQLSITTNNKQLKQFCEKVIQVFLEDDFKSICLVDLIDCNRDVVRSFLQMNYLPCRELDLFNVSIAWAKTYCQRNGLDENNLNNVRNQLGDCLHFIRFGAMSTDEIDAILSNQQNEMLFTSNELKDLLCIKNVQHFESKIFNHTPRSPPTFQWNGNKELSLCERVDGPNWDLECRESTWFSTNIPVLLGKITSAFFQKHNITDYEGEIDTTLSLIEYNDQSFAADVPFRVLWQRKVTFFNRTQKIIALDSPILIRPGKMYEIRIELTSNTNEYEYRGGFWISEFKLDEEVTIKSYQSPLNKEGKCGLVRDLDFNRF